MKKKGYSYLFITIMYIQYIILEVEELGFVCAVSLCYRLLSWPSRDCTAFKE